jgi:hypothetical protein
MQVLFKMVMPAAAAVVDPSAAAGTAPAASPTVTDQHPLQAHDLLPIILSFTIEKDCRDLGKCLQVSKTWNGRFKILRAIFDFSSCSYERFALTWLLPGFISPDIGQGDLVWQEACKTSFKLTKRVTPEMVS